MDVKDFFEEYNGEFNPPHVESKILGIELSGYAPKYRGGCMAVIPYNENFLIMSEDDDNYFDNTLINYIELINYREVLYNLSKSIDITMDFKKGVTSIKYILDRESFYNHDFSQEGLFVSVKDRENTQSPIVIIKGYINESFSIYWAQFRLDVINNVINRSFK